MSKLFKSQDLSTYMGKTLNPGQAATIVEAVNAYIEARTKRCWGETRTVTERYDWAPTIWLRHQDVTAVAFIKLGYPGQTQVTVDASNYWSNELGRVTLLAQARQLYTPSAYHNDFVEISYTYGVPEAEVPSDLKHAALVIAANFYNWATSGNKEVTAAQVGSYRLEYRDQAGKKDTTGANWAIVDSYAMRRL